MNDPHVVALIYRVLHAAGTDYNKAEASEHSYPGFLVRIDKGLARFEMNDHFATEEEARKFIEPFIEAWQVKTDLERSPGEFRLEFVSAEIVDRDAQPAALHATGGTYKISGVSASLSVARGSYPPPPEWPVGIVEAAVSDQVPPPTEKANVTVSPPAASLSVSATDPTVTVTGPTTPRVVIASDGSRKEVKPERQAELGALVESAQEALAKVREALADPGAAELQAELDAALASSPGMGHNNPPLDLDEAQAVVEEGAEALNGPELHVARLLTVRAALKWVGERFTTFADAFAKSLGVIAAPALLAFLASELPGVVKLLDKILTMLL